MRGLKSGLELAYNWETRSARLAGRSLPGETACLEAGGRPRERKVRAPQDTVVGNAHRPSRQSRLRLRLVDEGQGKCNRKDTARAKLTGCYPWACRSKGEKVGGLRSLNVRAHQQPGDRLARQTPPGARPNMRAGRSGPLRPSGRSLDWPSNRLAR